MNFKSLAFKNPEKFWALSIEQQKNSKISRRGRMLDMHGNFWKPREIVEFLKIESFYRKFWNRDARNSNGSESPNTKFSAIVIYRPGKFMLFHSSPEISGNSNSNFFIDWTALLQGADRLKCSCSRSLTRVLILHEAIVSDTIIREKPG